MSNAHHRSRHASPAILSRNLDSVSRSAPARPMVSFLSHGNRFSTSPSSSSIETIKYMVALMDASALGYVETDGTTYRLASRPNDLHAPARTLCTLVVLFVVNLDSCFDGRCATRIMSFWTSPDSAACARSDWDSMWENWPIRQSNSVWRSRGDARGWKRLALPESPFSSLTSLSVNR